MKRNDVTVHACTEILPRFKRNGWYFDRKTKKSWYEVSGRAFELKFANEFLEDLECLGYELLSVEAEKALLFLSNTTKDPVLKKALIKKWTEHTHCCITRQYKWAAMRGALRLKKFKADRGIV